MKDRFVSAYSKKERVTLDFTDEDGEPLIGRTKQAHKEDCDIIRIMKKFDNSGLITHINNAIAEYGDYTTVNEYQESLNMVLNAQEAFNGLPSEIRRKFANDPGTFLEFATNPKNEKEMVELGLAEKIVEPEPIKVFMETAKTQEEVTK